MPGLRFLYLNHACGQRIYQAELTRAERGRTVTRRVTRWILQRLDIDKMSIAATAKALGLERNLVNDLALDACRALVYDDPGHLDDVRILGVDEHVWKHTHRAGEPDSFVTVLVDITPSSMGPVRTGCWTWSPGVVPPYSARGWASESRASVTEWRS